MSNPLFEEWTAPFQTPPLDRVRPEHFPPAYDRALAEHSAEIAAIAENRGSPSFDNVVVALEKSGRPPGGGMRSWEENWKRVIKNIRNGQQENPERYVEYIVTKRREAGLSELSFLASPEGPSQSAPPMPPTRPG